ncbi:MAG: S8 family serine peptidase [Cyclobacteriaceae bacterium]
MSDCKKFVLLLVCFQLLFFIGNAQGFKTNGEQHSGNPKVVHGKIVVKLGDGFKTFNENGGKGRVLTSANIGSVIKSQGIERLRFGGGNAGNATLSTNGSRLDNIYIIDLPQEESIQEAIDVLLEYPNVIYAVPFYQEELLFTPNDTNIGSQTGLGVVKAFEAWDVTKGDESIIIGVSDTGVQMDHLDLANNLFFNEADPINGLDDDGNGYIDDFQGWDFADIDNDPTADQNPHGTQVAGISSAVTNNNLGMAGIGYNSKFVPLKVFTSSNGSSFNTYNSIIYAADQGYDVINLSWGSTGSFSPFAQDVINYAVLEKDMVVVAAAGNTNEELEFYPASYDHVLSVANTDMQDVKAPGATFSYKVDLTAPGVGVYSTKNGNSYASESGSSFSSPHVAGTAALVKSVFPHLNALQVMEQIRVTADDVYDMGNNSDYTGQLGKGRLNVFRAVSEGNSISMRINNFDYSNSFGEYAFYGDTVNVELEFFNYLNPTSNATATLSSSNPNVSIPEPVLDIGALGEMTTRSKLTANLVISEEAQHDERIIVRVDFSDDNYEDFQYFEFEISPDNIDVANSTLDLNISANGNLGHPKNTFSGATGFVFNQKTMGKYLGIMVGNHPDSISDNVLNDVVSLSREQDFEAIDKIKFHHHSIADLYTKSSFEDSNAGITSLGLVIEQEALNWSDAENDGYIIVEYRITNNTNATKENLRFGAFANWDVDDHLSNKSLWDQEHKLAYTVDQDQNDFVGMALLTSQDVNVHSIDMGNENGNTAELSGSFSGQEKFEMLTTEKQLAGEAGIGNDVAQILAAQVGTLLPFESRKVSFVISAAIDLAGLQDNVIKAATKYAEFVDTPPIAEFHVVCANQAFELTLTSGSEFEIYDDSQMTNLLSTGNGFGFSGLGNDSLLYVRNMDLSYPSDIFRVAVLVEDPGTDFFIDPDTLYLGDNSINRVNYTDLSEAPVSWEWSLGNGSSTTIQHPWGIYNEPGTYEVNLEVTTELGCIGSKQKNLVVAERSPEPILSDQSICKGDAVKLKATNSNNIRVYKELADTEPIYEGDEFVSTALYEDSIFYVSSFEQVFESHKVSVSALVDDLQLDFVAASDTINLESKNQINFSYTGEAAETFAWFVNENPVGTEESMSFIFTEETTLDVELRVTNITGCTDALSKNIEILAAPTPEIEDISICQFDEVVLSPTNGNSFYFYTDASLSQPIKKGRSLLVDQLSVNTTYYITNVDGYKESDSKAVMVEILPFDISMETDPEILILSQQKNTTFSFSSDQEIVSSQWFVNDSFVESNPAPVLTFDESGDYDVKLTVLDSRGCRDTTSIVYQVLDVPITSLDHEISNLISLYPNPTEHTITLKGAHEFEQLVLVNPAGQKAESRFVPNNDGGITIDLSNLQNGVYFLRGTFKNTPFVKKVLLHK